MKKKELFQSLKVIALALILAVGVSYATGAWEDASGTPPENNAPRPVNVSDEVQTKMGDLYIENPSGSALLTGDLLSIWGPSSFNDQVSLGIVGGTDENVPLYVSGNAKFDNLAMANNDGITYPAHICASEDGSLMPCEGPAPLVWGDYFACAMGEGGCPTAIIGDTTWRPVPFGNNNGENNIFGVDPDTTPGLFWVLQVYYSGAWHNLLAEGAPTSSAGEGCWDWIEESFPAWDGNVTHVRIQQTHDEDWYDPDIANSTVFVSPGYGGCIYQDQVE